MRFLFTVVFSCRAEGLGFASGHDADAGGATVDSSCSSSRFQQYVKLFSQLH